MDGGFRQLQADTGEAALSPDGSRIVFEKDQELWQMGPNGENLVRLSQLPHAPQFAGHAGLSHQLSPQRDSPLARRRHSGLVLG